MLTHSLEIEFTFDLKRGKDILHEAFVVRLTGEPTNYFIVRLLFDLIFIIHHAHTFVRGNDLRVCPCERNPISAIAARARECGPYLQAIEAQMNETSVTIDGVRSPLLECGPPNASEAAVFVHGNPGSNRDWQSLARGVGQFGRAVAVDLRPQYARLQQLSLHVAALSRASAESINSIRSLSSQRPDEDGHGERKLKLRLREDPAPFVFCLIFRVTAEPGAFGRSA
jgi:hypothetical protein